MKRDGLTIGLFCVGLFILGLVTSAFAYIYQDNDYYNWNGGDVVMNSQCTLNSMTNAYGGQQWNFSANTHHWGKVKNVNYPSGGTGYVTFKLWAGSRWDFSGADMDWATCGSGIAVRDYYIGSRLYKPPSTPSEESYTIYLTNTHFFGTNGHYIRAFTSTQADGLGENDQVKSLVPAYYP